MSVLVAVGVLAAVGVLSPVTAWLPGQACLFAASVQQGPHVAGAGDQMPLSLPVTEAPPSLSSAS